MVQGQLIGSYVHMREKPREQHALFMLRKIASLVKPIMQQRGFKVGCLAEFWPDENNLLGLNIGGGKKICIRLRQPYDHNVFLELEDCIYTMLHELTHNIHGPHDEKFHGLLKQLEDEYTTVRLSGYSGEGFYSNGTRLGVGRSHNPSMTDARRKALAAAEKRRVLSTGSGQKLGGAAKNNTTAPNYQELRERAAAAALRRARISKTCGVESEVRDRGRMEADAERAIMNGFRTQAEEDNANEEAILQAAIDLIVEGEREEEMQRKAWEERGGYVWIKDDDESTPVPVSVATSMAQSASPKHSRSASSEYYPVSESKRPVPPNHKSTDTPPTYEEALGISPRTWACDLCTLINSISNANCDACGVKRPEEDSEIVVVPGRQSGATPQPTRPGGLKRSTSVKTKQRVRFGPDPVTSVKMIWHCHNCTAVNDAGWTCTTCGIVGLSS